MQGFERDTGAVRIAWSAVLVGLALAGSVTPSQAALTTPACLAKKLKEWGKIRKCFATEDGKRIRFKPSDPLKCNLKFNERLAKLNAQAQAAGIACRFEDNGDGTVTDYDTGLQWEKKTDDGTVHDKDRVFSWSATAAGTLPTGTAFTEFLGTLNGGINLGGQTIGCFGNLRLNRRSGDCDWRLPSLGELLSIVDCSRGVPCVDQALFGPTSGGFHWTNASNATSATSAELVSFSSVAASGDTKAASYAVRAVRSFL